MISRKFATVALCLVIIVLGTTASADEVIEVAGFGSNPGNLKMYKFVPAEPTRPAPLVVALHGCTQHAADYGTDAGWIELARRWGFVLLLPEQRLTNNLRRCFNWFNGFAFSDWWLWAERGSDQDRDEGEALSIRQMIERMQADHAIDSRRVFVTGISAGGAMTAVMLATYPEVFAAGAILAGSPYKCASTTTQALLRCGVDLTHSGLGRTAETDPALLAKRVFAASAHRGPWPRVSIWHGDADPTVDSDNARELMKQWTTVHDIDQVADHEAPLKGFPRREYRDASGVTRVETVTIPGLGHAIPVDPGTGADRCGRTGTHYADVDLCASFYIGRFWGIEPEN